MDNKKALELWLDEIGDQTYSYDFSGKKIKKDDYAIKNQVGWVISFIKPIELGGKKHKDNIIIMHHRTHEEKGLNYPKFSIDHKDYICRYDENEGFHYIEEILDDEDD